MKRYIFIIILIMLFFTISMTFISCSKNTSDVNVDSTKEITLTAATSWAENDDQNNMGFWYLQEKINKISNGKITINWVGGPETFPAFELGEAVRDRAVDIGWLSPAYYTSLIPEVGVLDYSELTFKEERKSSALDYLNGIHREKMNSIIICSGDGGKQYSIYTNKPVSSIKDFKGMRIRVSPSYLPFIRALEAETVLLPGGEMYTAMERATIDGYTWPYIGITAFRLEELTKYKILPYYWRVSTVAIINYDTWNSLPQWAQDAILEAALEVEAELPEYYKQFEAEENEILKKHGIEFVKIKEADEFLELARQAGWERIRETVKDNTEEIIAKFSK